MPQVSPRGTYLVIADALRRDIKEGSFAGTNLPSENSLMETYRVSRNTVRRALKTLESESLIRSLPGTGWQVATKPAIPLIARLINVILEDSLAVGDTYPSESQLCDRLSVSRTAVRRALNQMEGQGLLSTIHGKGRSVRALPSSREEP
ncbi:winged helix-turn-helix domain-containing protein [Streptomyces lateritius]|nr:winged helix-turn-helix domain-containing protein [Streptomyces lateritius]